MEDLERMAAEKWRVPDAEELHGHARHVALLVKKYAEELEYTQFTESEDDTTQGTTQCSLSRTVQESVSSVQDPFDCAIPETQQVAPPNA